jgi:hypothetical protein
MDELVRLPIVNEDDSGLFIHETIRNTMFRGWLTGPDVQLFKDLNRRLVESFVLRQKQRLDESFDSFVQSIVFHTFAYDETHAIQLFGTLFQHERERQRLGSCQLAIDWAAEYGNYLGPRTRTQLNLYSGISRRIEKLRSSYKCVPISEARRPDKRGGPGQGCARIGSSIC